MGKGSVKLLRRMVKGLDTLGFEVSIDGEEAKRVKLEDVILLGKVRNALNFSVKNNKIVDSFGAINRLDIIRIKKDRKEDKYSAIEVDSDKNLLELMEVIEKCWGRIHLNSTRKSEYIEEGFERIDIGGIAYPKLSLSESKLNASLEFKVPGLVIVSEKAVLAYKYRNKKIVNNGELTLDKIKVTLPKSNLSKLKDYIDVDLIEGKEQQALVTQLENLPSEPCTLCTVMIDIKGIRVASDTLVMGNFELLLKVRECTDNHAISKILSKSYGYFGIEKNRNILESEIDRDEKKKEMYNGISIHELFLAGVNPYTGHYSKGKKEYSKKVGGESVLKMYYETDGIEIGKINFKNVLMGECATSTLIDDVVEMMVAEGNEVKLYNILNESEKKYREVLQELWENKVKVAKGWYNLDSWVKVDTRKKNAIVRVGLAKAANAEVKLITVGFEASK